MRRLLFVSLTFLGSGCALRGHGAEQRAAQAPRLIIEELRSGWRNGQALHADSSIVIVLMETPCTGDCRIMTFLPVPREVSKYIADSLHARLAMSSGKQCNKPTPTVKRDCHIPGDPSVLTLTVPPLDADSVILKSDWDRDGKGTVTSTLYTWSKGYWISPFTHKPIR